MGGNGGMNTHLSEILSWLLEPLATSMMGKSSEVISDEDLNNKMDTLNMVNKDWKPEEQSQEPIGTSPEMEDKLSAAPGLCGVRQSGRHQGAGKSRTSPNRGGEQRQHADRLTEQHYRSPRRGGE